MKRFTFTQGGGALTEEQRQFYEDNGYIIIKNNVSHALLDEMRDYFVEVCNGSVVGNIKVIMEDIFLKNKGVKGEFAINKIQDFIYDDILFKYCADKAVVDVIQDIIGPNITGVNSMIINKPPNSDPKVSQHPLHQDFHFFPFRPAERVAASWTAMEHVDENNGCLYVVPGSHKGRLYPHFYPHGFKHKLYYEAHCSEELSPKINVVMEKGDTLFFHPLLLHGSGPNYTKGFRKAISCHYANSNCYFVDVKGTTQEGISKEVEGLTKSRKARLSFIDFFKTKSRLIRGAPGAFQTFSSHL